jgi:hypothetical protein
MADAKISALTGATTPLAGTEVVPVVQGGQTRKVSVADLTTGRAISATELTLTTGNLIVSNGKGIDFSATSGAGTSELLAEYEEGNWTPIDSSGAGLVFTSVDGKYTKTGNIVTARCTFTFPSTANAAGIVIGGLPFTTSSNQADRQGFLSFNSYNGGADTVLPGLSATTFQFRAATGAARTNVEYSAAVIYATCIYGV